jgi:hypothetical protein
MNFFHIKIVYDRKDVMIVSVVKNKRTESQFMVFKNLYRMRREINNELLFDFGYRRDKAEKKVLRMMGKMNATYDELDSSEREQFDKLKKRYDSFEDWFIREMKIAILTDMRDITSEVFMANSIYPTMREELIERRIHQDRALGYCARLQQNLFTVIMELPVDHNKYTRLAKGIENEVRLIKKWRQSDGRFRNMILTGDIPASQETIEEEAKLITGNPFTEINEDTFKLLGKDVDLKESEDQQKNKGMPERVFVRG